jgi:hypothetical protein
MPFTLTTDLYSPCNPVTTISPCNKLYQDAGYSQPALPGVYVWLGRLYFVSTGGTVYSILDCPGPCGWNGPDCTARRHIQCNVIQSTPLGLQNICTNFTAACCECLGLSPCI